MADTFSHGPHTQGVTDPDWALDTSQNRFLSGSQLLTRDGRVTGNAYLSHWTLPKNMGEPIAICVTDAGNVLKLGFTELKATFYAPEWTMIPLPAHIDALEIFKAQENTAEALEEAFKCAG